MIAIAESGSTKCEWVILNEEKQVIQNFKTQGFNPDFHDSDFIFNSLSTSEDFLAIRNEINTIYFYGASCSSECLNKIVVEGLQRVFANAKILVDHDLLAAAYSLYEGEPLVCCILGTGSNSCFYDGAELKEMIPALGFIMGDEAGGAFFGKRLLSDFFYNKLPKQIHEDFERIYQLTWAEAREKIYGNIHANVYLASFMPFIGKYKEEAYVQEMIREGFAEFIKVHVSCFDQSSNGKIGFVGSIAFIFKNILMEELLESSLFSDLSVLIFPI